MLRPYPQRRDADLRGGCWAEVRDLSEIDSSEFEDLLGARKPPAPGDTMFVHISPRVTCVGQAQRCAEHLEAARSDPQRLVDAVRCGHLALMAGLTEALSGSAGIGAFSDKLAGEHLEFIRGGRPDMPGEFTRPFLELFAWAQDADRMEYGAIEFTAGELRAASEIDRFRTLIDHPKPTFWSVENGQLVDLLEFLPGLIEKCVASAFQRYLNGSDAEVADALKRIRAALPHVPLTHV